ncbi:hypothetical protein [Chryseobacterium sp. 3008163]|uniref:hypothetical protein n=1 Tax=Chryseobacterium sp. 3008163 TaxID=2478663 RepID=UPI000F0D00DE|nr:hypothetical protein [Chryseobacterium sp. 3008163]AYN01596.1 hypothetical protein EAG08_15980 [Chryseobacterium sp. 3008163]
MIYIRLVIFLFIGISNLFFTQTKQEIISKIIEVNSLDAWDGILNPNLDKNGLSDDSNYYNFEKLKKIISHDELLELSHHKNQVVRLYAIGELIRKNNTQLNVKKEILEAISKKKIVQTHSGCIVDRELTYSIIYHNYWSYVRGSASKPPYETDEKKLKLLNIKAVNEDYLLRDINSEILNIDKDLYWLIYDRAFEIEKYDDNLKKNIIRLLYKHNNSYAFEYLNKNYPEEFKKSIYNTYFEKYFSKAKFNEVNQTFYLFNLAEYAFENNNVDMQNKILQKLKTTKGWEKELGGSFNAQIFEKYNIKL